MNLARARADEHYSVELIGSDLSDGVLGYLSTCSPGLFITRGADYNLQPLV